MLPIEVVVVLALATYRAQRLLTGDSITEPFRHALYRFAWREPDPATGERDPQPRGPARAYLFELLTCPWCLGIWTAGVLYVLWRWGGSVPRAVVVVLAVAGAQGFLSAREGDE